MIATFRGNSRRFGTYIRDGSAVTGRTGAAMLRGAELSVARIVPKILYCLKILSNAPGEAGPLPPRPAGVDCKVLPA